MFEIGLDPAWYVVYRVGSHIAHAGPSCTEWSIRESDDGWCLGGVVKPSQWREPFCIAGWCVAQTGVLVLKRHGAPAGTISQLIDVEKALRDASLNLAP